MSRLTLDRDFSRFLEQDDNFPHRVEVYIGERKVVCSGLLLAQQSSVLEQKIKDEDGILMLDEMTEIGSDCHKFDCLRLLYGAPVCLNSQVIETVLKFSSIYKVEDMFTKALKWIKQTLTVRNFHYYFILHKQIDSPYFKRLQSIILEFIQRNSDHCCKELSEKFDSGQQMDAECFMAVLKNSPESGGTLLTKWASESEHIPLILENSLNLNFLKLFPNQIDFSSFLGILTQQHESMETMKAAITLQQKYFADYATRLNKPTYERASSSTDVPDSKSESKSTSSKARSASSKARNKCSKNENTKPSTDKKEKGSHSAPKTSTSSTPGNDVESERKIFVGNIPDNATKEDIENVFSVYGFIVAIDLILHRKCAFVEFRSVKSSRKLLNLFNSDKDAIKVLSNSVYLKAFDLSHQSKDEMNNANPEKKVFVGNVPENASVEDIQSAFASLGPVKVTLLSHRKCAFLEYEHVKTVRKTLNMFANGHKFVVLGTSVYVKQFDMQKT